MGRPVHLLFYLGDETMKTLSWPHLRALGRTDNGNRWYPNDDIKPYFAPLRAPSRAWPNSYAKAAQTLKFARWLRDNNPALADQLGVEA
jgi:hypothetical protein